MTNQFNIVVDSTENKTVGDILYSNLKHFNESMIGAYETKPFCIYATNKENEVIGGVKGDIFGHLCRIFTLWIDENYRRKNIGTKIFKELDKFANDNNCKIIQTDTTEFQSKEFYEKMGFTVCATLPDNFMGYKSYILRKKLFKNEINIPKIEIDRFLQESLLMYAAAKALLKYPLLMKQCSVLYHYAFELLLKGSDIYENSAHLHSHDLYKLLKRVKFIKLDEDDVKHLRIISDYFNYRYPLSENVFDKINKTLQKNADEDIPGILPLPNELGTDDLEKADKLYNLLFEFMPPPLNESCNKLMVNIKKNILLV
ncbi:TPA: GNAT family N-acetyltransferase [Legionella pneumophila]|nr:GNAT family N-acetyltransferase [Legionella pneumophila]